MPVLSTERAKDSIVLNISKGTITFYKYQLYNDFLSIRKETAAGKDVSLAILEKRIVAWDLTNEAGKKLPVTAENIGLLPMMDLNQLFKAIKENTDTEEDTKKEQSN